MLRSFRALMQIAPAALILALLPPATVHARTITVKVEEGTKFSVARLPSGAMLIDLQGAVWRVPAKGGRATRVTTDELDLSAVAISPDGRTVAMQGYTGRGWRIFVMAPDGGGLRQLTDGPGEQSQPSWSPDGRTLAFVSSGTDERPEIWLRDMASDAERQLTHSPAYSAKSALAWAPDGASIAFVSGTAVRTIPINGGTTGTLPLPPGGAPSGLAWSPSGRRLAFVREGKLWIRDAEGELAQVGALDDVFPFTPHWQGENELLYTANGRIRASRIGGATKVMPFSADIVLDRPDYTRKPYDFAPGVAHPVKGIVAPALSPDGKAIAFRALGSLWLQQVDGEPQRLTDASAWQSDPAWSPDGASIAYSSDAEGGFQLFLYDTRSRTHRRLTTSPGQPRYPFWSPDGKTLGYFVDVQNREEIWALDTQGGGTRRIAAVTRSGGRASWSPDGRTIVMTATDAVPFAGGRTGYNAINVADGTSRYFSVAPGRSITTRADNGPIWSPDGRKLLFVMENTLWTLDVQPDGTPLGTPVQIANQVADAPSWTVGGILFLSNGKLTLLDKPGARPKVVETHLGWSRPATGDRLLVRAGALWDGKSPALRRNVDILIQEGRIRWIRPRNLRLRPEGVRIVDATALTVTPGLVDGHVHTGDDGMGMGRNMGPLLLSFGITSVRSTGDIAYRALEDKETRAAGLRLAPRLFWTGELIEGTRHSNGRNRVIESEDQLALEVSRIKALDYDFVKVYRFFPSAWQKRLTEMVHGEIGIPLTSHYLFPNVAHGMDAQEHLGGPTRWGMDDNHIKSHGNVYRDVFDVIVRSGLFVTTTNFASSILLAEDPGLATDPRIAAFFSDAEKAVVAGELACAQGTGKCGAFLAPDAETSRQNAEALVKLAKAGARIVAGTDVPWDSPAISLHLNLRSLQKAGLSPFETLRTATIRPAEELNVAKDLGTVEPGKLADLIMVRGDPSRDVRDLANVEMIVLNGGLWSVQDLLSGAGSAKVDGSKLEKF